MKSCSPASGLAVSVPLTIAQLCPTPHPVTLYARARAVSVSKRGNINVILQLASTGLEAP